MKKLFSVIVIVILASLAAGYVSNVDVKARVDVQHNLDVESYEQTTPEQTESRTEGKPTPLIFKLTGKPVSDT